MSMTFEKMAEQLEGARIKLEAMQRDSLVDNSASERERALMNQCHRHLTSATILMIDAKKHRNKRHRGATR